MNNKIDSKSLMYIRQNCAWLYKNTSNLFCNVSKPIFFRVSRRLVSFCLTASFFSSVMSETSEIATFQFLDYRRRILTYIISIVEDTERSELPMLYECASHFDLSNSRDSINA